MSAWPAVLWWYAAAGLLAYLAGAVPCGYLVAKARGVDIRTVGSGNVGATNVFRAVGKGWGVLTFFCDALKGFLPVWLLPPLLAHMSGSVSEPILALLCAVMAVAGHNWPVYLRFKGGKGVATSAGALLAIAPGATGVGVAVWLLVFLITRYVSMASISAAAAVAGAVWFSSVPLITALMLNLLGAVIIWRHRANIQRLRHGTELRAGGLPRTPESK
ncbi:MAG: glycerol-3-phosphate 1-O-acyltransferase PlsY [Kiritimatiellia bacterium]|nr:glycerol-3-phosphate 1-O-acyltransferase PlsY [Lentisphaerota bacterium]